MKSIAALLISIIISGSIFSQTITKPNFALATHPIVVDKISLSENSITITLTVKNQLAGSEFCANELMYIQELKKNRKANLLEVSGIPICPSSHKFENPGEELTFKLEFSNFNEIPKYINIIEDCNDNCFSIYGVVIDEKMNEDINQGYSYFKSGNLDFALASFRTAARENAGYPFALLYGNIIEIYALQKNFDKAKKWYQFLQSSKFIDKDHVIEQISRKDFFDELTD